MKFDIKKINIPTQAGCYLMKSDLGEIIYIGKAKNLRNRVKTYFLNGQKDYKTSKLVLEICDIEFIITNPSLPYR